MKTIDILGEVQYEVLLTNLLLYYTLTDEEKTVIEEYPLEAVNWIKNAIIVINANTTEIKKILNDGGSVKLEELDNLLNSKRELLRIKDALDDSINDMRTQAMALINEIEQLQ